MFHADGYRLILAPAKFPPTVPYLVYTLPLVHLFLLGKPYGHLVRQPVLAPIVLGAHP